jgi:hypothetical protein
MTTIELLPNCYYRFTKKSFDENNAPIVFEAKLIQVIGNTVNVAFYNDGINKPDEYPTIRSIPIQWIENAILIVPSIPFDLS